jgi:hypothetical protein
LLGLKYRLLFPKTSYRRSQPEQDPQKNKKVQKKKIKQRESQQEHKRQAQETEGNNSKKIKKTNNSKRKQNRHCLIASSGIFVFRTIKNIFFSVSMWWLPRTSAIEKGRSWPLCQTYEKQKKKEKRTDRSNVAVDKVDFVQM